MILRLRAYQLVEEPESAVMIALPGSRSDSSETIRIGLTGSAWTAASSATVCHQSATFFSTVSRQLRSSCCSISGSSACRVARLSPTRLTSVG